MMQWIEFIVRMLESELGRRTVVAALVPGFVTSWCVTQGWKFWPFLSQLSDAQHRGFTRLVAFAAGFGPVAYSWPLPGAPRWTFAIMVGVASPVAYTLVVRTVRYFWPWLADRVSARPAGSTTQGDVHA